MSGEIISSKHPSYKSTRFDILEMLSFLKQDVDDMTNSVKLEIKNNIEMEDLVSILEKLEEVKKAISNVK